MGVRDSFNEGWEKAFAMLQGRPKELIVGIVQDSDNESVTDEQLIGRFKSWCSSYDPQMQGSATNQVFEFLLQARPKLREKI